MRGQRWNYGYGPRGFRYDNQQSFQYYPVSSTVVRGAAQYRARQHCAAYTYSTPRCTTTAWHCVHERGVGSSLAMLYQKCEENENYKF